MITAMLFFFPSKLAPFCFLIPTLWEGFFSEEGPHVFSMWSVEFAHHGAEFGIKGWWRERTSEHTQIIWPTAATTGLVIHKMVGAFLCPDEISKVLEMRSNCTEE